MANKAKRRPAARVLLVGPRMRGWRGPPFPPEKIKIFRVISFRFSAKKASIYPPTGITTPNIPSKKAKSAPCKKAKPAAASRRAGKEVPDGEKPTR